MARWLPLLLSVACVPPANTDGPPDYVDGTPEIVSFTAECNVKEDRWELALQASFWTGGVDPRWAVDGEVVELHTLKTDSYAEDGQGEKLSLNLSFVLDPAEVDNGNTAYTCADDPSAHLVLYETDGSPIICMDFAAEAVDWDTVPDLPECP